MKKRIISMLLVIVMVLALVPVQALAEGELTITSTKGSAVIGKDQVTLTVAGGAESDKYEWSAPESVTLTPSADTKTCTLEGKTQGTVTVTVKTEDGTKSGKKDFQIYLQPEELKIIDADTKVTAKEELKVGETLNLGFTCKNLESIQGKSTKWEATDVTGTGVLTVDQKTGALEAKGVGTAKVTLAFNGGRAYQTFTVSPADLKEMTVTPAQAEMYPNRTLTLTASVEGVKWESDNPDVASVDPNTGVVTSHKVGEKVTITATKNDYKDATCVIDVVANAYRITDASGRELGETEELKVGQKMDLKVRDKSNTELSGFTFSVDGGTGITVTSDGKMEATAKTTAPVEVKAVNGITVKQKFSVLNNTLVIKAGDVTLNAEDGYSVAAGNQVQLTAVDSVTGETVTATWNIPSSVYGYASVNPTGLLDAKVATTSPVTLTVSADGYDDVTLPVTVRAKGTFSKLKIQEGEKLIVNQPCHLIALDAAGNAVAGVKWEIVSGGAELDGNVLTVASTEVASVRVKATHPDYAEKPATFNVETVTPTEVKLTVDGENFPAEKTMIVGDKLTLIPSLPLKSFPSRMTSH